MAGGTSPYLWVARSMGGWCAPSGNHGNIGSGFPWKEGLGGTTSGDVAGWCPNSVTGSGQGDSASKLRCRCMNSSEVTECTTSAYFFQIQFIQRERERLTIPWIGELWGMVASSDVVGSDRKRDRARDAGPARGACPTRSTSAKLRLKGEEPGEPDSRGTGMGGLRGGGGLVQGGETGR